MAWKFISPRLNAQPIEEVSTVQKHYLGERAQAFDETYGVGEFVYAKGVTSGAKYAWAVYNADDWTTTLLAADSRGPVGIMMSALDAATDFGWLQIYGKAIGKCLTQFADDGRVFATSTAGSVDDASVAGDAIFGAKGASLTVVDSGVADFEIHYPFAPHRVTVNGA